MAIAHPKNEERIQHALDSPVTPSTNSRVDSFVSKKPANPSQRIFYLDALRVLAIFAVINIHASAHFLLNGMSHEGMTKWWIGNSLDTLSRWCVPVFVMVSGQLLLSTSSSENISRFFRKRLLRVGTPFIVWSIIYFAYKQLQASHNLAITSIGTFLHQFLSNGVYYHLWFMYMIIGVYLFTPVMRQYVKTVSNAHLLYPIAVVFLTYNVSIFSSEFLDWKISTNLAQAGVYLGYFLLGIYLYRVKTTSKQRLCLYALAIASLIVMLTGTFILTTLHHQFDSFFYKDPNVLNAIVSCAVFLFVKERLSKPSKHPQARSLVQLLSQLTMGVYLIHPIFLNAIPKNKLNQWLGTLPIRPLISVPIVDISVFALSAAAIFLLQKVPLIRRIVP